MKTPWGEELDPLHPLPEHPRPRLLRDSWINLNGPWDHAITPIGQVGAPVTWDGTIVVPFSPEAPLSGVERVLQPDQALWYRRHIDARPLAGRGRVLLHFGAVDQECEVRLNGTEVGRHSGGYLPFSFDVTEALQDGEGELVVRVTDVTDGSWHSRGKQHLAPAGIWYSAQSGIWQTVWLEGVPTSWIKDVVLTPQPDLRSVEVEIDLATDPATQDGDLAAEVVVTADGAEVGRARVRPGQPTTVALTGEVRTWSPEDPFLHDVVVRCGGDEVRSYFGMRTFGTGPDAHGHTRLLLNGHPYLHAGLLDQGYWPDGLYTAPSDEALARDIELARSMGFTMLRKHIKIEPLRWYHHCDRLGMLVWQDFVNGGRPYNPVVVSAPAVTPLSLDDRHHRLFGRQDEEGRTQFLAEAEATVALLRSVTSIAVWVPFNEGWGQFDAAAVAERVRSLDPTRTIDHASGWHDQHAGDLVSRHVYFRPYRVSRRDRRDPRATVLSEYAGYSHRVPGHTWTTREFGYRKFPAQPEFARAFRRLHDEQVGPALADGLAAFVHTQLSDVEHETNGLVTYDRRIFKIPPQEVKDTMDRLRALFARAVAQPGRAVALEEREITTPTPLTLPSGRLNPGAVGWTRTPLITTDGIGRGWFGKGRNKRWEYWAVTTPSHVIAVVTSDIDYAGVHGLWVLDRGTGEEIAHDVIGAPSRGISLPGTLGQGPVRTRARGLDIDIEEVAGGTRIRARGGRIRVDVVAHRPEGHESLGVVVPWSDRLFQYTVKDVARPASGQLWLDGQPHPVPQGESWATLDHGRGRWPYSVRWNWGAGSGRVDGRPIGIQVGGKWTDGTGSVENAVVVDGHLTKISEELVWDYDPDAWTDPWRVHGRALDLTFTPFHLKRSVTDLLVFNSRTHQCFGTWEGWVHAEGHGRLAVSGLTGWAEDVHNRW